MCVVVVVAVGRIAIGWTPGSKDVVNGLSVCDPFTRGVLCVCVFVDVCSVCVCVALVELAAATAEINCHQQH
ncbi:hypothetical protein FQN60_012710 [Etheostoma spectabile]|uniref:Uncharacterized protein n=1 Tax=Etheostoma spectabile TaxID=54343 RepID=A0A5J5D9X8_9PERO|nr:hypothetical protein FQN60_012710 [Etheostoma spectabile]